MAYVEPKTTLPKVKLEWADWPLKQRILDVGAIPDYTALEKQTAVAITLQEQPKRIPNGNCVGLMCFADKPGWGWKDWPEGREPIGYFLAEEGALPGSVGVFLAFALVQDSLAMLLSKVKSRHIWQSDINTWGLDIPATAKAYAEKWVAVPSLYRQSVEGFTKAAKRVLDIWPSPGHMDGWMDAGASRSDNA